MSGIMKTALLAALLAAAPVYGRQAEEGADQETVSLPDTDGEQAGAATPDIEKVERLIVERTNAFRKEHEHESEPVAADETLSKAAREFARYMAGEGRYGHEADGRTPAERATAAGYDYCIVRENIAYAFQSTGFTTAQLADRFVTGWQESPGHRENMLAPHVTQTAVAVAKAEGSDVYVAVQLFARPKNAAIEFEVANESELTVTYRVGNRELELAPRVVQTHTLCEPKAVVFLPVAAGESTDAEAAEPPGPVAEVEPKGGERLSVVPAEEGYRVDVRRPAGAGT